MAFVLYLQIDLHFPAAHDLKAKRKEVQSVKAQIQKRCGAAVAETDHHDLWQRAELGVALVARDQHGARAQADSVERLVQSKFPDGVAFTRSLVSSDDLLDS
jgi:uncharacterized protein YlxP (DUF503 family)